MFSFDVEDSQFRTSKGWCGNRPQCVAVAKTDKGVAVRDTKDATKTTLFFTQEEWAAFTNGVKDGEF